MSTTDLNTFHFHEARLLDENRLDEWLTLFTPDGVYWMPMDENVDPKVAPSIIYDDHLRLEMRVEQLMRQRRVAQSPASEVVRMITNTEVEQRDATSATIRYVMLVIEARGGDWRQNGLGVTRQFPSRCVLDLVKVDDTWRLQSKKVIYLNRLRPVEGLSFIL